MLRETYDDRGNRTEYSYHGVNGELVMQKEGVARVCIEFDPRGFEVGRSFFGARAEPVLHVDGYHAVAQKVDMLGRIIQRDYLGLSGEPVRLGTTSPDQQSVPSVAELAGEQNTPPDRAKRHRRGSPWALLLLLVAVVACGLAVAMLVDGGRLADWMSGLMRSDAGDRP